MHLDKICLTSSLVYSSIQALRNDYSTELTNESNSLPFVRKLRQKCLTNGTGFENVSEKRHWLELYHLRNTMALLGKDRHFSPSNSRGSLALVNQTNCTKNFSRFGKNGKKVIPRKVFLFFRKISTGMNCSIWILPGITGFSIQMVSAPYNLDVNFKQSKEWQKEFESQDFQCRITSKFAKICYL